MASNPPQEELLRALRDQGITSEQVLDVIAKTPREKFVAAGQESVAYNNTALPIDCAQTISQPLIVAMMTEALELTGTERVLEIGTGSGYQAAILSPLCREILSIERHRELSEQAAARFADLGIDNVRLFLGDGSLGLPSEAPYDGILVTAAMPETNETIGAFLRQLREGGRLVAPVGSAKGQTLRVYERTPHGYETRDLCECRFVPLIGEHGQTTDDDANAAPTDTEDAT
jgi:protein-L-isoaspartate(D-aspartate) O-methyltransferase